MQAPLVTVIVPNFNHARFLPRRLDSIFAQQFTDFEVIILDDHSTDDSRRVIESYSHRGNVRVMYNSQNSGSPFAQWKKGIELARGTFIWIAESDDYCDNTLLRHAIGELNKGDDLFYCRSERVNENGLISGDMNSWYGDLSATRWLHDFRNDAKQELSQYLFRKNTIVNASAVVFRNKPEVLEWINAIADMRYCGDWLFWMMYLASANNVVYSASCKNYFRFHDNVSRRRHSKADRNQEVLRVLDFVLTHLPTEAHQELVNYYFSEHLYRERRARIRFNLRARREQLKVSPHFARLWRRYYLGKLD